MQDLRVIGVEGGALLVASDDGERYRILIDELLQSRIRQVSPEQGVGRKLSPREIQDQIRSGMSAQDVASVTGMPVEYIEKYEGPILAEREHVVLSALEVSVHTALDTGPIGGGGMSFGTAIRSRLGAIGAINERWASWKDPNTGWVVKLSFTAEQIEHDARWSFDPKKLSLAPLNTEATTLSQQGDLPAQLVPRLRAVAPTPRIDNPEPDNSRFDSGAFVVDELPQTRFAPKSQPSQSDSHQTADLLDALRRRRGERESAPLADEDPKAGHPSTGSIRIVDVPIPDFGSESFGSESFDEEVVDFEDHGRATLPQPTVLPTGRSKARKGRTAMPSWDDIVFGARADDDPA